MLPIEFVIALAGAGLIAFLFAIDWSHLIRETPPQLTKFQRIVCFAFALGCFMVVGFNLIDRAQDGDDDTQTSAPATATLPAEVFPLPSPSQTLIPTLPADVVVPTSTPTLETRRIADKDGMVQLLVPEGVFRMGSTEDEITAACEQFEEIYPDRSCDRDWFSYETPAHNVFLSSFWIDETEVTNAQYRLCVEAGNCTLPDPLTYYNDDTYTNHPVGHVNWHQATAYCEWAGRALPTEAQWEKAARGTEHLLYPWGDQFDGTKVNYCDSNCTNSWADKMTSDGYERTAPVGSFPEGASPYGALDMGGNVWEWVADWYDSDYYQTQTTLAENPTGPDNGQYKVLRGGAWDSYIYDVRAAYRGDFAPSYSYYFVGVRCVQAVQTP